MSSASTGLSVEVSPETVLCVLHDVGPYHEVLHLAPLEVFADTWLLKVQSQLDTARDPSHARVLYTTTLDREALSRLRDGIDEALLRKPLSRSVNGGETEASKWLR